jgi:hypothetical protein
MTTHIEHDGTLGRAQAPECCVCQVGGSLFALIACCWLATLLLGTGPGVSPASDAVLDGYRDALARAEVRNDEGATGALVAATAPTR